MTVAILEWKTVQPVLAVAFNLADGVMRVDFEKLLYGGTGFGRPSGGPWDRLCPQELVVCVLCGVLLPGLFQGLAQIK